MKTSIEKKKWKISRKEHWINSVSLTFPICVQNQKSNDIFNTETRLSQYYNIRDF